jgi:hypothetical protein
MATEFVTVSWENLSLEERKRRVAVREATSQMMQGSIICEKYGAYAGR